MPKFSLQKRCSSLIMQTNNQSQVQQLILPHSTSWLYRRFQLWISTSHVGGKRNKKSKPKRGRTNADRDDDAYICKQVSENKKRQTASSRTHAHISIYVRSRRQLNPSTTAVRDPSRSDWFVYDWHDILIVRSRRWGEPDRRVGRAWYAPVYSFWGSQRTYTMLAYNRRRERGSRIYPFSRGTMGVYRWPCVCYFAKICFWPDATEVVIGFPKDLGTLAFIIDVYLDENDYI